MAKSQTIRRKWRCHWIYVFIFSAELLVLDHVLVLAEWNSVATYLYRRNDCMFSTRSASDVFFFSVLFGSFLWFGRFRFGAYWTLLVEFTRVSVHSRRYTHVFNIIIIIIVAVRPQHGMYPFYAVLDPHVHGHTQCDGWGWVGVCGWTHRVLPMTVKTAKVNCVFVGAAGSRNGLRCLCLSSDSPKWLHCNDSSISEHKVVESRCRRRTTANTRCQCAAGPIPFDQCDDETCLCVIQFR